MNRRGFIGGTIGLFLSAQLSLGSKKKSEFKMLAWDDLNNEFIPFKAEYNILDNVLRSETIRMNRIRHFNLIHIYKEDRIIKILDWQKGGPTICAGDTLVIQCSLEEFNANPR